MTPEDRPAKRRLFAAATVGAVILAATAVAAAASIAGGARPSSGSSFALRASELANHCYAIASAASGKFIAIAGASSYGASPVRARATAFYLKPTGLGTYLIFDRDAQLLSAAARGSTAAGRAGVPDASTEWAIASATARGFTLTSTTSGLQLAIASGRRAPLTLTRPAGVGTGRLFRFAADRGCRQYPEAQVGAFGAPSKGTNRAGKVSGYIDLHVHITANMRAGGSVIYGESFDRFGITHALSTVGDAREHGPNGVDDITGNLIRHGTSTGTHDNHGWPTFKGWPTHDTITHQQVYYVWLKRAWMAGLRLIVAQTVEDHSLCQIEPRKVRTCDEMKSIAGQVERLREMQDYIDAQSGGRGRGWFRLVYDAGQARRAVESGKLAVVIGVESSDPFGCSEFRGKPQCTKAQIDRGLDEFNRLGVRTMFPVHWVNNAFAGAALESGGTGTFIKLLNANQTGESFVTETCTRPGEVERVSATAAPQCNARGLTDLGAYLIKRMIAKHMLIEADHMSEKTRDAVLAITTANHYPLVSSHNGTGGAWSASQLRALYSGGGLAAVTPDTAPTLAGKVSRLARYSNPRYYFGVGLGTDTGGLGGQPGPRPDAARHPLRYPFHSYDGKVTFVRERTGKFVYDLNAHGVAHYGLLPDLMADIQQGNGDRRVLSPLFRSAEAYIEMWQRAGARR